VLAGCVCFVPGHHAFCAQHAHQSAKQTCLVLNNGQPCPAPRAPLYSTCLSHRELCSTAAKYDRLGATGKPALRKDKRRAVPAKPSSSPPGPPLTPDNNSSRGSGARGELSSVVHRMDVLAVDDSGQLLMSPLGVQHARPPVHSAI
jgi:hypothetical protein